MAAPFAFSFFRESADGVLILVSSPSHISYQPVLQIPFTQSHPLSYPSFRCLLGHGPFPSSAFALMLVPSPHSFPENAPSPSCLVEYSSCVSLSITKLDYARPL